MRSADAPAVARPAAPAAEQVQPSTRGRRQAVGACRQPDHAPLAPRTERHAAIPRVTDDLALKPRAPGCRRGLGLMLADIAPELRFAPPTRVAPSKPMRAMRWMGGTATASVLGQQRTRASAAPDRPLGHARRRPWPERGAADVRNGALDRADALPTAKRAATTPLRHPQSPAALGPRPAGSPAPAAGRRRGPGSGSSAGDLDLALARNRSEHDRPERAVEVLLGAIIAMIARSALGERRPHR